MHSITFSASKRAHPDPSCTQKPLKADADSGGGDMEVPRGRRTAAASWVKKGGEGEEEEKFGVDFEFTAGPWWAQLALRRRLLRHVIISAIAAFALMMSFAFLYSQPAYPEAPRGIGSCHEASSSSIVADIGAVASDESRCSLVGVNILKAGGNAVDAAVAGALCLGVLNAGASGVGGGAFLLVRMADGRTDLVDGREEAPAAATQDMYNATGASSVTGGLSIAVPGELAALHVTWQRYGRATWPDLLQPAIDFAENGFHVAPYLAAKIKEAEKYLGNFSELGAIYAPFGTPLKEGDICKMPKLAATLRQVAQFGPSALYDGPLTDSLVADIQSAGGIITKKDLKEYSVKIRKPLISDLWGLTFIGAPPPSSGGATVMEILNVLSGYALPLAGNGALGLHRTVEAMKHAFALRMNLGDPAFVDNEAVLADMLSSEFANEIRRNISDNTTYPPSHYGGRWNQLNDHGTSHLSVVDGERNAVSMTSTVNLGFGSKVVSPSTGIFLNDEMDDFSVPGEPNIFGLAPSEANFIRPRKRPLSSMAPTIVLQNGQLRAVVGGSGGPFIISAVAQVLLNYFVRGMTPAEAVEAPRAHHQLLPNQVYYESNFTLLNGVTVNFMEPALAALRRRGHALKPIPYGGVVQLLVHDLEHLAENRTAFLPKNEVPGVVYGKLTAVSDPRKDGKPAGW